MAYADRLRENAVPTGVDTGPGGPPEGSEEGGAGGPPDDSKKRGAGGGGAAGGAPGMGGGTATGTWADVAKRGHLASQGRGRGVVGPAQRNEGDRSHIDNDDDDVSDSEEGPWWGPIALLASQNPGEMYQEILDQHFREEREARNELVSRWLGIIV